MFVVGTHSFMADITELLYMLELGKKYDIKSCSVPYAKNEIDNMNNTDNKEQIAAGDGLLKHCEKIIPTVKLNDDTEFHDSYYNGYDGSISAPTLVAFAKAKGYTEFDLPVVCVDLATACWGNLCDFKDFLLHYKRCANTDLQYPIILDSDGFICDGWHRIAKAIIEGRPTVKAIRLEEMPKGMTRIKTSKKD